MTTTTDDTKMSFNSLQRTNQKLASNPNLSDHNKQVLEDFFKRCRSGGSGDAILRDYSSRFNKLADHIDFKLDNPSREDLQELYAKLNTDEIRKNNGEKYSDYSKDKFDSALSKFYNWFIKKEGKGYKESVHGPDLVEDLETNIELSTEVDPDSLPTPKEVRKVGNHAKNLRDKTLIVLLWSTGARVGEIFKTEYSDKVLTWENVEFKGDKAWITLEGKTGKREIPIKTGMPLLRELWEENDADLEDPVFIEKRKKSFCPDCDSLAELNGSNTDKEFKEYECSECDWEGKGTDIVRKYTAMGDNAVRRVLERTIKRAGLEGEFAHNPHDFGRKSRAVYKARIGYTDHQMRGFFGWSETSDAPKHYLSLVKEDLEKALAEEYGEEVEYDNGYDEEALRPIECVKCGRINSPVQDMCSECGNALTEQGEELSKPDNDMKGFDESLSELAEEKGIDKERFSEMLEEKSAIDLMMELAE
jgi:integrase